MDAAAPFSPYGHDLRMLEALSASLPLSLPRSAPRLGTAPPPPRGALSPLNLPTSQPPAGPQRCHLLRLPPELLDQILAYCLPYTTVTPKGIAWVRTSTALLATCRALHDAGAAYLYGRNTFVLRTCFSGTRWHMAWIRPRTASQLRARGNPAPDWMASGARASSGGGPGGSMNDDYYGHGPGDGETLAVPTEEAYGAGPAVKSSPLLVPARELPFPAAVPARHRARLRRVAVEVRVEDAYTGEIKYGFGGPGLAEGVRAQVVTLVAELAYADELLQLVVRLAGVGAGRAAEESRILAPLAALRNVRSLVVESGWPL